MKNFKNPLKNLMYGALFALPYSTFAQTFTENFGSVGSTSTIAQASPGFVNTAFTYTGTADVRNTAPSTTNVATGYAQASGNANIFITNIAGRYFEISGINTSTLTSMALSFGVSKNVNNSDGSSLAVETSTDGVNYTALTVPTLPTGSGTSHWYYRTASGTIPSVANLRIRWRNTSTTTQYRIDDVQLAGNVCTASITPSGATTLCNGGSVVLTANTGTAYLWSPGGATTQTVSVNQSATYNVTVTAADGCTATAAVPVRVLVYPTPVISASAASASVCPGSCTNLTARTLATDLIFSEYVEGSSNEKYIEIYNGTGAAVTLTNYIYQAFHNGTVNPTFVDTLSGTLADGAVLVLKNNAAGLFGGGVVSTAVAHNGNDALALYKISTASYVDIFGVIGVDPVSNWNLSGNSTLDKTLRRKASVYSGITINPALPGQSGFSTIFSEWDQSPIDDVTGLGAHTMNGTYTWMSGTTPTTGVTVSACPEAPTVYSVSGSFDASGCSASPATVSVGLFTAPSLTIDNSTPTVTCEEPCSDLTALVSGGTSPYTYLWSTSSTASAVNVCPTVTTVYSLTVTDANGCTDTEITTVVFDCGGGRMTSVSEIAFANVPVLNIYPNPFSETATLEVNLSTGSLVKIEVMDYTGKKVAELNNSMLSAGTHKFNWDSNNVANGLYFCKITSGNNVQSLKVQKLSNR